MEKGRKETLPIPTVLKPNPRQLSPLAANLPQVFLTLSWKFCLPKRPKAVLPRETPCPPVHASLQLDSRKEALTDSENWYPPSPWGKYFLRGRILTAAPTSCTTGLTRPCVRLLSCTATEAATTTAGPGSRLNQCPNWANATSLERFCQFNFIFLKHRLVSKSGSLGSPGNCWATQWVQGQRNQGGAAVTALSPKKPSN